MGNGEASCAHEDDGPSRLSGRGRPPLPAALFCRCAFEGGRQISDRDESASRFGNRPQTFCRELALASHQARQVHLTDARPIAERFPGFPRHFRKIDIERMGHAPNITPRVMPSSLFRNFGR